jgi:DNA-binding transcriptional MerR regulator
MVYRVPMNGITIGRLARQAGVTADSIRYYERSGLLPSPQRTAAGYRLYGEDALCRLRFIKGGQRLGLRLEEIRDLLRLTDRGRCPCGRIGDLVRRRLGEVEAELARLKALRTDLAAAVARYADCAPSETVEGPCALDTLGKGGETA